jgi:hypothetical protein
MVPGWVSKLSIGARTTVTTNSCRVVHPHQALFDSSFALGLLGWSSEVEAERAGQGSFEN